MAGSEKLMLDRVKSPTTQSIIPLGLELAEGGNYSFSWENGHIDHSNFDVYFQDKERNLLIPVSETFFYHFVASKGENNDRFKLVLRNRNTAKTIDIFGQSAYSVINEETLFIQTESNETTNAMVSLNNLNGSVVVQGNYPMNQGKIEIQIPNLPKGVYFAVINQTKSVKVVNY
jgi:hypothetical protein